MVMRNYSLLSFKALVIILKTKLVSYRNGFKIFSLDIHMQRLLFLPNGKGRVPLLCPLASLYLLFWPVDNVLLFQ